MREQKLRAKSRNTSLTQSAMNAFIIGKDAWTSIFKELEPRRSWQKVGWTVLFSTKKLP